MSNWVDFRNNLEGYLNDAGQTVGQGAAQIIEQTLVAELNAVVAKYTTPAATATPATATATVPAVEETVEPVAQEVPVQS